MNRLTGSKATWRRPAIAALLAASLVAGCRTPSEHRQDADTVVAKIMSQKQTQALGKTEPFSIERPSNILRRRLLGEQGLARSSDASLGADALKPIPHWPDIEYPKVTSSADANIPIDANTPLKLSLVDALQIGARNSFEYQSRKEDVFRSALDLDLERDAFRNTFLGQVETLLSTDTMGADVTGVQNSGSLGLTRRLESGAALSTALAVDLANLLTQGGASSLGLAADATFSIPLLRGSGRHIVTEPLTQAERNVVYDIYDFERFKRTFAVDVARSYLSVLQQMDEVKNAEENYRSSVRSARWSRRRADAGLLAPVEMDQAVQSELRARNGWISAQARYENRLDSFKMNMGLPPDARIELDREDLQRLRRPAATLVQEIANEAGAEAQTQAPPADAPVELIPPTDEDAGPLEIEETLGMRLAFENRLDLRVTEGMVFDAQRQVVVAADALGAALDLIGTAGVGGRRSIGSATSEDANLRFDEGSYAALLSLDLPLERTAERNAFRKSLIDLERATRNVQMLEDDIKLAIRGELRTLLESRESLKIQARSVVVAQKRVRSTTLFVEAGRRQIRDLLEAHDALLAAQNSLTAAVVGYRIAELELQRDLGLLKINEHGLWQESLPEELDHGTER